MELNDRSIAGRKELVFCGISWRVYISHVISRATKFELGINLHLRSAVRDLFESIDLPPRHDSTSASLSDFMSNVFGPRSAK